ncbi:tapasin isoform X2 [Notamacropus eugenii]|uniref:tapasin isoform X2 n=1 Tax=Notamacropus eugenii TaxID=9315 RepID=UPI003B678FDE
MKSLSLLLALGILKWAAARLGPSVLECWFVEEQGGGGGMLRGVTKRPAVLLLRQGPGEPPPRPDLDSSLYLKVYAVLTVLSHSPAALVRPGKNATLDLSFTYLPPNSGGAPSSLGPPPFGLEWRRQHRGTGQLLLAVTPGLSSQALGSPEGAVAFAAWDEEGVEGPWSGNGTLLLPTVQPHQEGTYLATIHLPHLQAQVALELEIRKPPKVTLTPSPMVWAYPGQAPPELLCLISHFYPPEELEVTWEFWNRTGGGSRVADGQAWRSSYRYHPDGTVSISAYLRPATVTVEQHGSRYVCRVHHSSLKTKGLSAQVSLEVAGVSGPSLEDGVGLFLSAFLLLGIIKGMGWVASFLSPSTDTKEKKSH